MKFARYPAPPDGPVKQKNSIDDPFFTTFEVLVVLGYEFLQSILVVDREDYILWAKTDYGIC